MMAIIALVLGLRPRTRTIISHNILGLGNNYYIFHSDSCNKVYIYYIILYPIFIFYFL